VLLSYRIPRKFKRLGVAHIGDGLAALPADARTLEQFEWLAEEIDEAGGSSTLWRAELTSNAQERRVVGGMAAARAEEYVDIAERARKFGQVSMAPTDAIRMLRSLRRELRQLQRRDFFPPPERESVGIEVATLARAVLDHNQTSSADAPELVVES